MNKLLLIVTSFFLFLTLITFVSAQEEYACTDTDNGLDYYTQGNVTYGKYDYVDNCGYPGIVNAGTPQEYTIIEGDLIEYACYGPDNDKRCTDTACRFIKYNCPNGCRNSACLKEKESTSEEVKCIFVNSKTDQKCYVAGGEASCSGVESCTTKISGSYGDKITWKSTCGGYSYSLIDGKDNSIKFECVSEEVKEDEVSGKGFSKIYWQCYDGTEELSEGETECKSYEEWKKIAEVDCQNQCNGDGSKCGVNSFAISNNCYYNEDDEENNQKDIDEKQDFEKEGVLICANSCPSDGKCYPFGYRKSGEYCSDDGAFVKQSKENVKCENNFECSSNVCVSNKCISPSLIEKIINWFRRLFGVE